MIRPLLQEIYRDNPWKMLVCCILLNLTKRTQVDGIRHELFNRYPTPEKMSKANQEELAELLQPLGLYNRRANTLVRFSEDWMKGFTDVKDLYGIGQYAQDSWNIFQEGDMMVETKDKVLTKYLNNYLTHICFC